MPTTANSQIIPDRLEQLRAAMRAQGLSAYIIASADPHLSEYLPGRWKGREFFPALPVQSAP